MALTKGDYLRPARSLCSSSIPTLTVKEASGATFSVGEVLKSTGGGVRRAGVGSHMMTKNDAFGVSLTTGTVTTAASALTTKTAAIVPCVPWMVFEAAVRNASTTASSYLKESHMFNAYALDRSASVGSGVWYVNLGNTSASQGLVTIIGFRDATGTTNGHVYFVFHKSGRDAAWL